MVWQYSSDIPDVFFFDLIETAADLDIDETLDLIRPLMNESGLSYKAHNPVGDASGIFQAMPQTLKNLGFHGDWHDFVKLNADQQLPWLKKYYMPYRGKLVNATAVYMATFTPAWLQHASEPDFVICEKTGERFGGRKSPVDVKTSQVWYQQNRGLDMNGDGKITVSDLTAAIEHADRGPRWDEIRQRLQQILNPEVSVPWYELEETQDEQQASQPAPLSAVPTTLPGLVTSGQSPSHAGPEGSDTHDSESPLSNLG